MYSRERHRVPLDVALPGPGARVPDVGDVADRGRRRARRARVPTRIGTPTARAAESISARASGFCSGSMSEAFSGQSTRSGAATRPASASAASLSVALTWLRSTASRWALNSRPSRGTLPCTTATVYGRVCVVCQSRGEVGAAAVTATRAATPASTGERGPEPVRAHGRAPAAASRLPASATPKVTSGAPPYAASQANGEPSWANASRPHGNPPNGAAVARPPPAPPTARRPTAASPAAGRSPPARPRARPGTRPRRRPGSATAPGRRRCRSSSAAGRRTPARTPGRARPRAAPGRRG